MLWTSLGEEIEAFSEQTVVCLLYRLHSRRIGETSSDVEDIIVGDLTAPSKVTFGMRFPFPDFRQLYQLINLR